MRDRHYKNIVFTNHALNRLDDRSLTKDAVHQTVNYPLHKESQDGNTKFTRFVNNRKVQVVASYLPHDHKWLVISVWVRGEEDKVPLIWQLLTLPFKILWQILKVIISSIIGPKKARNRS